MFSMRTFLMGLTGSAVVLLALGSPSAQAQRRGCCNPPPCAWPEVVSPSQPVTPGTPGTPGTPSTPSTPQDMDRAPDISPERFAAGQSEGFAAATPAVIGDFIKPTGFGAVRSGAFKIAENESPRPQDRIFINYNYFNNVSSDVHRETLGFEKTFADRQGSIGMRLPIFQTDAQGGLSQISGFGDISIIGKWMVRCNRETGSLLSTGMVLTTPTGGSYDFGGTTGIAPWILQPWVGGILNGDRAFVQGFSSVAMPTDWRDVVLFFNDISAGFWLRRDSRCDCSRLITGIAPVIEAHLNTPLNHRGSGDPLHLPDWFVITAGSHFVLNHRSVLTLGAGVPVTGPSVYDYEIMAQFNLLF